MGIPATASFVGKPATTMLVGTCFTADTKAAPLSSFNLVTAVYGDVDLLNIIETVNEGNKQEGEGVAAMALFNYLLLPCTPKQSGNVLRR